MDDLISMPANYMWFEVIFDEKYEMKFILCSVSHSVRANANNILIE